MASMLEVLPIDTCVNHYSKGTLYFLRLDMSKGLHGQVFAGRVTIEDLVKPHFVFRYTVSDPLYPLSICSVALVHLLLLSINCFSDASEERLIAN